MFNSLEEITRLNIEADLLGFKKIEVKDIEGPSIMNRKCHWNCVNYAKQHPEVDYIVGVVQEWQGLLCAHFICKLSDGTYVDPTYASLGSMGNYYLVYEKNNFDSPNEELGWLKKYLVNKYTPKTIRYRIAKLFNSDFYWDLI